MNELPYFAIHLQKPDDSILRIITKDELKTAEETLRVLDVKWNVNSQYASNIRSILGTMEINKEQVIKALEEQLPGVVITIENQEDFAHEEE